MDKFTVEDINSQTWRKVKEYCAEEIERLRIHLEADADQDRTASLRGSIKTLKLVLRLEEQGKQKEEEENSD